MEVFGEATFGLHCCSFTLSVHCLMERTCPENVHCFVLSFFSSSSLSLSLFVYIYIFIFLASLQKKSVFSLFSFLASCLSDSKQMIKINIKCMGGEGYRGVMEGWW